MKKGVAIFLIIILVLAVIAILIYILYPKPFLDISLKEGSFQGIVDKSNVMFTREDTKNEDRSCNIYLKNILSNKETLLTNFNYCPSYFDEVNLYLSQDKKQIAFATDTKAFEWYINHKTLVTPGRSIYNYNIHTKDYTPIFNINKVISDDYAYEYRLNLEGFSPQENKILFDKTTANNTAQKVEIYVYDLNTRNLTNIYENLFITKFITNTSTGSWDEGAIYNPLFTRWSPNGEAIIFETQLGGLPRKQYIIYLDNLIVRELNSENVRGDINTCGYWYNSGKSDEEFLDEVHPYSSYLFRSLLFPDGKTYLQRKSIYQVGCFMDCSPIGFKFYIKKLDKTYCNPF